MRINRLALVVGLAVAASACAGGGRAPVERAAPAAGSAPARVADAPPTDGVIVVAPGDTMYSLARRYGVSLPELAAANGIADPSVIAVGQTLRLPAAAPIGGASAARPGAGSITVSRGDTLYSLSRRAGLSVGELAGANGIAPPYTIHIGQVLTLPGSGRVRETPLPPHETPRPWTPPPPQGAPPLEDAPSLVWPARGELIGRFGERVGGVPQEGIAIGLSPGSPVRAAAGGVVTYAGDELAGYGNLVVLDHGEGWVTVYAHNESLSVSKDDRVGRGDVIARSGASGAVETPQLRFEVRRNRQPVDPLAVLPANVG